MYSGEVIIADTFDNGLSIYYMADGGFTFIDSTSKYKDGDTATVKQQIIFKRKWSVGL